MNLSALHALSPIDGRYSKITLVLKNIFSEYSFLKYRLKVEIEWFKKIISMSKKLDIDSMNRKEIVLLNNIMNDFNEKDAIWIKNMERKTNHDVKAIEYFLKKKIKVSIALVSISEFIHFSCTSDDINNISYALMLKDAREKVILPLWDQLIQILKTMACKYHDVPVLSLTHGQAATPSTIGKEMAIFCYRLKRQYLILQKIDILGKMNGATGNYNAHIAAYPLIDWHKISEEFVTSFGISWNPYTTQIEPHDYVAELCNCIALFNTILIDFNRDMWGYISLNYFKQKIVENEIGSSIMPHKVNPIDFEKSEGNLGISNALMRHMSEKLPISRWQRDLSDSTVLRNLGAAISHAVIAYDSALLGINKIEINSFQLLKVLDENWSILSEPIQTVMRRYGIKNSYEEVKKFTRGRKINQESIHIFIDQLTIPAEEKKRLKNMTPASYIGQSSRMVNEMINRL